MKSAKKQTKEEKSLVDLLELYGALQELKKKDQARGKKTKKKDEAISIEKAKKLLESARIEENTESSSGKKRPSAILRKQDLGPSNDIGPLKKPRLSASPSHPTPAPAPAPRDPSFYTRESRPDRATGNCQIFVGDLNESLPEDEQRQLIQESFSKYGEIISVRLLSGRNYGFIIFRTQAQATAAIDGMNRQFLGGTPVRVSWAKERTNFEPRRGSFGDDKKSYPTPFTPGPGTPYTPAPTPFQ